MPESEPSPRQTLAVLLGASKFPRAPKLERRAFYNSAQDFQEYLIASDSLSLPRENVNSLFDDSRSPTDQLLDIKNFLESRTKALKNEGTQPQDLIVYYVGHGLFTGAENSYCFAIRATDERSEGLTSIRASDLASTIKDSARFLRRFLILDCCFAGKASIEFQSGPLAVARAKLLDELPLRGTTLLCSSSAQDPSLAPEGLPRTMFSDGLLKALRQGHRSLGRWLSLSELGDLIKVNLREAYPDNSVRPEVHSPDQREGDVAHIGLFPNAAWVGRPPEETHQRAEAERKAQGAEEERRRTETQKAREEAEARERAEAQRKAREEAEEARKKAEAQEAHKQAEEARRKAEAKKARQEAEEQKKAEAEREARKKAREAQRKAEAKKAREEAEAQERAREEREARRKAREAQRKAEAQKALEQEKPPDRTPLDKAQLAERLQLAVERPSAQALGKLGPVRRFFSGVGGSLLLLLGVGAMVSAKDRNWGDSFAVIGFMIIPGCWLLWEAFRGKAIL